MKKIKDHYAAPGADETFLRPELGSQWAPREIAVCACETGVWMAWIHRREGAEYPVFCFDPGNGASGLQLLENAFSFYSKPVFLPSVRRSEPELAVFAGSGDTCRLRIYDIHIPGTPCCIQELPVSCQTVYHSDGICLPDASRFLLYSGVVAGRKGISLFLRRNIAGCWQPEELCGDPEECFNRARLAVDNQGRVIAVADAWYQKKYRLRWRCLTQENSCWQTLYEDDCWNLFPSLAVDRSGRIWASWLKLQTVRRQDVAGLRHQGLLAQLTEKDWEILLPEGESCAADLNLGLLPLKRYFGYDGLRRYPRIAALQSGEVLLFWEQQKDEQEIWDNLHNGQLLGRIIRDGRFSPVKVLTDRDCCFTVDCHISYPVNQFPVAVKGSHRSDGQDFSVRRIDLACCPAYLPAENASWRDWVSWDFSKEIQSFRKAGRPVPEDSALQLFWGDLHCHSVHSPDAEGEADELYHFARDIACLDFVAVTDNDFYPGKVLLDSEIHYIAKLAEALSDKDFLAFSGYEWTFHRPDGRNSFNHRIILFPENERAMIRRNEKSGSTEEDFARYLKKHGYFAFPHHGTWELLADEPAVEVTSAWGTYILDADTIWQQLNQKRFFAFLGNSDSHRFMPGLSGALTGVFAEDLSREGILSALRKGRCFATTGNRTAACFYVNECFLGGSTGGASAPLLRWQVFCQHRLDTVKIFRDGIEVFCSGQSSGEWRDDSLNQGSHWYILQVKEQGDYIRYPHNVAAAFGKYLWTSPIRFQLENG